jgi:hypothetical protein
MTRRIGGAKRAGAIYESAGPQRAGQGGRRGTPPRPGPSSIPPAADLQLERHYASIARPMDAFNPGKATGVAKINRHAGGLRWAVCCIWINRPRAAAARVTK